MTNDTRPASRGEYEGFYIYGSGPGQPRHRMTCVIAFAGTRVSGFGGDDVGEFFWQGTYDEQTRAVHLAKFYATHAIDYDGFVDNDGDIWGQWYVSPGWRGGFRLWPKGQGGGRELEAEQAAPQPVEEPFVPDAEPVEIEWPRSSGILPNSVTRGFAMSGSAGIDGESQPGKRDDVGPSALPANGCARIPGLRPGLLDVGLSGLIPKPRDSVSRRGGQPCQYVEPAKG